MKGQREDATPPKRALPRPEDEEASGASTEVPAEIASLRHDWESEAPDTEWTSRFEDNLLAAMTRAELATDSLGEVSCRRTLCRLTFLFDDPQEGEKLHRMKPADHDVIYANHGIEYEVFLKRKPQ